MVKRNDTLMDRTFAALSDPTRRAIVRRLAEEDNLSVSALAAPFERKMSLPAVSKHLRVLERAGLLEQRKDGRIRRCHLQPEPLRQAHTWIAFYQKFWSNQLDALADFFEPSDVSSTPFDKDS